MDPQSAIEGLGGGPLAVIAVGAVLFAIMVLRWHRQDTKDSAATMLELTEKVIVSSTTSTTAIHQLTEVVKELGRDMRGRRHE